MKKARGFSFGSKALLVSVAISTLFVLPARQIAAAPATQFSAAVDKPKDIGTDQGLEFSKSKEYRDEFSKAVEDARKACRDYLKDHPDTPHKGAIVSDIDETLLDNRRYFEQEKEFSWPAFKAWIHKAEAPSLTPTARFLAWARENGFAVFLITGRTEDLRGSTIKNLVKNGIAYDGLYLRPEDDHRSAIDVKKAIRKDIETMGFDIVVNIGDQVSDLVGGYAIDCEKLPNKIYFVH